MSIQNMITSTCNVNGSLFIFNNTMLLISKNGKMRAKSPDCVIPILFLKGNLSCEGKHISFTWREESMAQCLTRHGREYRTKGLALQSPSPHCFQVLDIVHYACLPYYWHFYFKTHIPSAYGERWERSYISASNAGIFSRQIIPLCLSVCWCEGRRVRFGSAPDIS